MFGSSWNNIVLYLFYVIFNFVFRGTMCYYVLCFMLLFSDVEVCFYLSYYEFLMLILVFFLFQVNFPLTLLNECIIIVPFNVMKTS